MKNYIMLVALCFNFSACLVGPDFVRPENEVDQAFDLESSPSSLYIAQEIQPFWWESFKDPVLDQLVHKSITGNRSLAAGLARVNKSRAIYRQKKLDIYPIITSGASFQQNLSSNSRGFELSREDRTNDIYSAGIDTSWEVDFFGRVRRGAQAAEADYVASIDELKDLNRIITSDLVRAYFELRGNQKQLEVAHSNAQVQEDSTRLVRSQAENGQVSQLDLERALTQLNSTLALVPPLEAAVRRSAHQIAVLVGEKPTALNALLLLPAEMPEYQGPVSISDPAKLLQRRPDVRAAESRLDAATARIGVEKGNLFPKVTFLGALGYEANSIDQIKDGGSDVYNFGPSIFWPAFGMGSVVARIDAADAETQTVLANYEEVVLNALREVQDSLVEYSQSINRVALLDKAWKAGAQAGRIAKIQYKEGLIDFRSLLETQLAELAAERAFVQSQVDHSVALVMLYKALGGGWEERAQE